jgi:hypothetical protein
LRRWRRKEVIRNMKKDKEEGNNREEEGASIWNQFRSEGVATVHVISKYACPPRVLPE